MAMTMNGQVQLPASREVVWAKLNNPEVLITCIPGGEQLEKISDSEFRAVAPVKVGPVKARWKGRCSSDLDRQAIASPVKVTACCGLCQGSSIHRRRWDTAQMMSRRRSG
jgi:carbon monoxide dehydrogenase subunit G